MDNSPQYSESDDSPMLSNDMPVKRGRGRPPKNVKPSEIKSKKDKELFMKMTYARKYRQKHKERVESLCQENDALRRENNRLKAQVAKLLEENVLNEKQFAFARSDCYFPEDLLPVNPFRPNEAEVVDFPAHRPPPPYPNTVATDWQKSLQNGPGGATTEQSNPMQKYWQRSIQLRPVENSPVAPQHPPHAEWKEMNRDTSLMHMIRVSQPSTPPMDPHQNPPTDWERPNQQFEWELHSRYYALP
uniref:BZIP domain-containing protein n=1 Tax=Steinernema glaseri TaxID=37863 RepID=A0A1I7ZUA1_9BILA